MALVDEDASISRRAAAAELRARADLFKREAERLEAEAEAVSEAKTARRDETSPGAFPDDDDSELAQRAARTEAALASARWVGATVRVATTRDANRREKSKKSMLRVKTSRTSLTTSRTTFRTGVIVKTRAAFVGGSTSDRRSASGAWAVVCLARFEDGDEHELTLAEAAACAADVDADDADKVVHTSSLEADEDAETEPVGSAFVRDAVEKTKPAVSSRSTRSRGAKRAREPEETTSARSLPRRRGRPPLGALSSNEAFRRSERSERSEGQEPKGPKGPEGPTGTFPGKKETTREAPDSSGSGSKSVGARRGRKAPEWAVRAVETMGLTLGCAKCRKSKYGCGTCRERAGICDPKENPPALALPSPEDSSPEDVRMADSGFGSARRRGGATAAAAASAAKRLGGVLGSSRGKRRRTGSDGSEEAFVNVGDISDVTTKAELKKRLPRGVKLGCSKCRQCWRGCNACRKANGVWIAPASNWVARGASQSPPSGACLALPAC